MGTFRDTDRTSVRIAAAGRDIREARDDKAYWNILAFAKERPDAADWARDILAALGLDADATCPPESARLFPSPDEGKGPGPRPKTATAFDEVTP
jgi:hypothetical protein